MYIAIYQLNDLKLDLLSRKGMTRTSIKHFKRKRHKDIIRKTSSVIRYNNYFLIWDCVDVDLY